MAADSRYEHWLEHNGLHNDPSGRRTPSWRYVPKIELTKFNLQKSQANQARLDAPIDEQLAERYFAVIVDQIGEDPLASYFPAVIVYLDADGRYVIIDGNHRVKVKIDAGIAVTDAYVVRCNDEDVLSRLTKTANTVEGKRNSLEHDLQQVKALVENNNYSVAAAAKTFGLKLQTCEKFIRREKVMESLRAQGLRHPEDPNLGLKQGHLEELYFLEAINPKIMLRAAETIRLSKMDLPLCKNFLGEVRKCTSDHDRWQKLAEWESKPEIKELRASAMNGRIVPTQRRGNITLRAMTTLLAKLQNKHRLRSLQIVGTVQTQQFLEKSKAIREHLLELEKSARG